MASHHVCLILHENSGRECAYTEEMHPLVTWRNHGESWIGRQIFYRLAALVPGWPFERQQALGRLLGRLHPRLSRHRFDRVCRDIQLAFGDTYTPEAARQIARDSYLYLGESLIEFFRLPTLTREEILATTVIDDADRLAEARAAGRGAILLTAHVGNWEVGGTALAVHGYPITGIARPQDDPLLDALLGNIRRVHGMQTVDVTDVKGCLRVLRRNEFLGLLGDVDADVPGAFVPFFGRPAATYTGAAYLAHHTGACILPIFDTRLPDGTHRIRVHPPVPPSRSGDPRYDLLVTTLRTQHVIEQEVRRRPAEWFWQLQRWKTRPEQVPHPERIPMAHRDLTEEEIAQVLAYACEA